MTEVLTSAQMRAIERAAIISDSVTGADLMERAGRGAVSAIMAQWPDLGQGRHHAVVLCGPGNNGGDGAVMARLLRLRGWHVEVLLVHTGAALPPEAAHHHRLWSELGPVSALTLQTASSGSRPDVLVDALFGIGLSRPLPLDLCAAIHAVRNRAPAFVASRPCRVVAVDCPSGLDCDTGRFLLPPRAESSPDWWSREGQPRQMWADLTVTFHAPKPGHYTDPPASAALRVIDIGLKPALAADPIQLVAPGTEQSVGDWLRSLRVEGRHKVERGHVLVCGGGPGQGGAARLAARSALRAGAGLVTIATPPEAMTENAARLDAVMLRPLEGATALATMLEDRRIGCLCLGPGLGLARARELVPVALKAGRRVVLDADGLSAFAGDPEALFALCRLTAETIVMTPHEGEFTRLFPDLAVAGASGLSRIEMVRRAARRSGAVVLLKGAVTVIASPEGPTAIHSALYERAVPQLATAGAGDVLAGLIAGLIASPLQADPFGATGLAAWLHAECARVFGPGLIAEDLPETLPAVLSRCL